MLCARYYCITKHKIPYFVQFVITGLTIINSELMHLWKKGPAEQVAEIAEARENERQLVAATLMQLRKDLVDFDQHVQDAVSSR